MQSGNCVPLWVLLQMNLPQVIAHTPLASTESSLLWVLGANGEDCTTTCTHLGRQCEDGAWPVTLEAWKVVANSTPGLSCSHHAPGTWDYNPALCTEKDWCEGVCYWEGFGARCSGGTQGFPSPIARRICPCQEQEDVSRSEAGKDFIPETVHMLTFSDVKASEADPIDFHEDSVPGLLKQVPGWKVKCAQPSIDPYGLDQMCLNPWQQEGVGSNIL